jgi:hypothetical protein
MRCTAIGISPYGKERPVKFVYTNRYRKAVVFVCADEEKWGGSNSMIEIIISVQAVLLLGQRKCGSTVIAGVLPPGPRHFIRQTSERV